MAKLAPPYVEGTLPAFYADADGTAKLVVPYSMGRTVSKNQVKTLTVKIKSLNSSAYLISDVMASEWDNEHAVFNVNIYNSEQEEILHKGMFYKVQIAYVSNDDEIGYFSSVSVIKFTTKPTIEIDGLSASIQNLHKFKYVGRYSQGGGDITEKVLTYRFDIYDEYGNIVQTSGNQLHNSNDDVLYNESIDSYLLSQELKDDQVYSIQYTVNTINNMEISTPIYKLIQRDTIQSKIIDTCSFIAKTNYDDAYTDLMFSSNGEYLTGFYSMARSDSEHDYLNWEVIYRFTLKNEKIDTTIYRDFIVEQGKTYKYSLQQYNINGIYSNRLLSNEVYTDFEDMYLYDGERQLKIKYNPKVSSFKATIPENKQEAIGAKYPYIIRNGQVNYKEFPISGLISYWSDDQHFFMGELIDVPTTNLTSSNIYAERRFKLEVLDWLNNGKPKVFKSVAEGNYLVHLTNVSLQPNDTVGRMLHTFTTTAYEAMELTYDNLVDYGIINIPTEEEKYSQEMTYDTFNLAELPDSGVVDTRGFGIKGFKISGVMPGTMFKINGVDFVIGATGSYEYESDTEITSLEFLGDPSAIQAIKMSGGLIGYSHLINTYDDFDQITGMEIVEVPVRSFKGPCDIIEQITHYDSKGESLLNEKLEINKVYTIQFERRAPMAETGRSSCAIEYYETNSDTPDTVINLYEIGTYEAPINCVPKKVIIGEDVLAYVTYSIRIKNYIYEMDQLATEYKTYLENLTNYQTNNSESILTEINAYLDKIGDLIERDRGDKS